MHDARASERTISTPLEDPFANWMNDDLLLNVVERKHFERRYPRLMPLFDWPELREAFETHEQPARIARRMSRRFGVIAVAIGFVGLVLTALTPWLALVLSETRPFGGHPELAERWTGGTAAILIALGTFVGVHQTLFARAKREWLINRYAAERIRQFHFQLILNNLDMATAATGGGAAIDAWITFRQKAFEDFAHDMRRTRETTFDRLDDDHAEESVWIDSGWSENSPPPAQTEALGELLRCLAELRIGVQERYAELKLKPGFYSPRTRAEWLHGASDLATAAVLLLTLAVGVLYVYGTAEPRLWLLGLLGCAGSLTVTVVALRVLNEGLLLRIEAERYQWYLASVRSLLHRFRTADTGEQLVLLRDLERLAYREMRRFLVSFKASRFIM